MYIGFPIVGILFYLLYLHIAAIDMVYSDYIRLINSYLPDVWDPKKFFVPDLLTRIPVNYLERAINVEIFGYSVTFDRVLSVLCFGISALILGAYSKKHGIQMGWYAVIMLVMFSLNKWEMLYNGTGWAHFLAFAFFYYNYYVLDRVYENKAGTAERGRRDRLLLILLPPLVTLGVAGPYCAIYSMTLILAYLFIYVRNKFILCRDVRLLPAFVIVPLLLYLWSNSQAVYEYSGAAEGSLVECLLREPVFFIKFLLKSFASTVFGVELINRHMAWVPGKVWCLLGLLVIASYLAALWLNFSCGLAKKTILPLMLLAGGGMNHLMVLVSRWIFMPNDSYGMSSRYALQYEIGILGILLTFALVWKEKKKKPWLQAGMLVIAAMFLAGNLLTTAEEFSFGRHRKNHNLEVKNILLNFEQETEDTLKTALEYRKPGTREALTILKENGWNIFREEQ